jgi:hypothetical protein
MDDFFGDPLLFKVTKKMKDGPNSGMLYKVEDFFCWSFLDGYMVESVSFCIWFGILCCKCLLIISFVALN